MMAEQTFESPITSLCMTSETFLVAGLYNGTFQGWNLTTNSIDVLTAHTQAVTSLYNHQNYIISGSTDGEIKVRDIANGFNPMLEGKVIPDSNPNPQGLTANLPEVRSLTLIETGAVPIVVAGDYSGQITLLTIDAQ